MQNPISIQPPDFKTMAKLQTRSIQRQKQDFPQCCPEGLGIREGSEL